MGKRFLSLAVGLALTATVVFAQVADAPNAKGSGPLVPLPSFIMVEKGTRNGSLTAPSAGDVAEEGKGIPGGFTLQSTDQLREGRGSNFQDLLRGAPGVFLQSESEAEATKISIRGSGILSEDEPSGVQFLLDGLTLNQADGEAILEDFDLATVKYAEVFRGANAFSFGSLTLGGAINLVSLTGYDADSFNLRAEGGSYGYWRGQAVAGGVKGDFDGVVSALLRRREGFREHSAERLDRLSSNFGYRLGPQLENRVYVEIARSDRAVPGGLTKDAMNQDPRRASDDAVEQDFHKHFTLVRVADKITFANDAQRFEAGLFWFHRKLEERGFFSPDIREGITALRSNNFGAMLNSLTKSEIWGRRNRFTVGLNAALEIENAENFENLQGRAGLTTARGRAISFNGPLHGENVYDLTDKLSAVTGAQLIVARRKFSDRFLTDDQGDQSRIQTFYGFNPKVGLVYATGPASNVFISASRSWQPPSFNQLLQFEEGPNASVAYHPLRPQHAWTLELGTRGEHGPWEWEFSVYHSRVQDELLELNDAQGRERGAVNVSRTRHRGVEAGLELEILEILGITQPPPAGGATRSRVTLSQSYTLNDFSFRDDPVYRDHRMGGIPRQVYEMDLTYEAPSGFYIGPSLQWVPSHYPVDHANLLLADPYTLLGFRIGFAQAKKLSLFLEVKNLLGKTYASSIDPIADGEADGNPEVFHPGEGRAYYAGLSWAW